MGDTSAHGRATSVPIRPYWRISVVVVMVGDRTIGELRMEVESDVVDVDGATLVVVVLVVSVGAT
jgi:hypothetical protein